jgi:hypothetical protein
MSITQFRNKIQIEIVWVVKFQNAPHALIIAFELTKCIEIDRLVQSS